MAEFAGNETDSGRKLVSVNGNCSQENCQDPSDLFCVALFLRPRQCCAQSTLHYTGQREPDLGLPRALQGPQMTSTGTKPTQTMPNLLELHCRTCQTCSTHQTCRTCRTRGTRATAPTWPPGPTCPPKPEPHGHAAQTRPHRNRTIPTKDSEDKPQNQYKQDRPEKLDIQEQQNQRKQLDKPRLSGQTRETIPTAQTGPTR